MLTPVQVLVGLQFKHRNVGHLKRIFSIRIQSCSSTRLRFYFNSILNQDSIMFINDHLDLGVDQIFHLAEDGFDLLMVGHHVNEEVDTNLRICTFVNLSLPTVEVKTVLPGLSNLNFKMRSVKQQKGKLTRVTCSSKTDQEPLRIATSAVERWR